MHGAPVRLMCRSAPPCAREVGRAAHWAPVVLAPALRALVQPRRLLALLVPIVADAFKAGHALAAACVVAAAALLVLLPVLAVSADTVRVVHCAQSPAW